MARVVVITNPAAARTEYVAAQGITQAFKRAGWRCELLATGGPGDARRLAEYALGQHADIVVVYGGDGTTMQAAAALVGSDTPLGIVPGGTGNLLAGNLRLPRGPAAAVRAMLKGAHRTIDLGRMERLDGTHFFAVAAGAGTDARVMAGTTAAEKRRWGMFAYAVTALRILPAIRPVPHLITVDGEVTRTDAAMVLVANCGEIVPPILALHPHVAPDDGVLDVVTVRAEGVAESLHTIGRFVLGDRSVGGRVLWQRGTDVTIVTDPPEPVELDGESAGQTPFRAVVVPHAIRILMG
ncbi:MAG: diacylglycerol kinase family lipid kinase [Gemmatimonadales bacterium]|nr:diacylglycerol kinase family lipid kinase [Gemmatimonadales bacterium]